MQGLGIFAVWSFGFKTEGVGFQGFAVLGLGEVYPQTIDSYVALFLFWCLG